VKRDTQPLPKSLKLSWGVGWPRRSFGIDRAPFELVPHIPREKVDVKVGRRIAMDLVVHLNGSDYTGNCRRNAPDIGHECIGLSFVKVVKLDGMATED
jgi:hypothetical protein